MLLCLAGCRTSPSKASWPRYPTVNKPLAEFILTRPQGVFYLGHICPYTGELIVVSTNEIFITHEKDGVLSPYPWSKYCYRKDLPSVAELASIHIGDHEDSVKKVLGEQHFFGYHRYPFINIVADRDLRIADYQWFTVVCNHFATMRVCVEYQQREGIWSVRDIDWQSEGRELEGIQPRPDP